MTITNPTVSIVVPSYNHSSFVTTLIDSIYSQSYRDFELIVLDDGSKDSSPELLKKLSHKYRFTLVLKENEGLCKTLNRGIKLANGKYVTLIASDDFIPENRLKEQVSFLEANPDIDVVAGSMVVVDINGIQTGSKVPSSKGIITFEDMLKKNKVNAATAMIRRDVYTKFGFYNEEHIFEDFGMWLKVLIGNGKIFNTTNMWAYYRIDNRDLEKKFIWYYKGVVQVLEEYSYFSGIAKIKRRHTLVFMIKMALLIGSNSSKRYAEIYRGMDFFGKLMFLIISLTPQYFRFKMLRFLKLSS